MRLSGVVSFMVASLCLAGCSSTSGMDALDVQKPSNETTSSVVRPSAPITSVPVAKAKPRKLAEAAPVDEPARPFGLAEEETAMLATPELPDSAEPPVEPVALVSPSKLLSRNSPPMFAGSIMRYGFRDAKPINFGRPRPGISPSTASMSRAGKATSTGGSCAPRAPTSPTSRRPMAVTISTRCS